jgi:hypothetical protein
MCKCMHSNGNSMWSSYGLTSIGRVCFACYSKPFSTRLLFSLRYVRIGPGSSVGIANDYGLDGPEIESGSKKIKNKKFPVGARFFAHVQTGPGAHPTSCTMGTGSFPGVKRPGRAADHQPPPSAEVNKQ